MGEGVLVSAATGALQSVLEKLFSLMDDEFTQFKGVRGEIEFLTRELTAMKAFLLKKSMEEDPDVQDKVWMKEVRELSYDIEDSLDDFMVRVGDGSAKPDGFMEKLWDLLKRTKDRRQIAKGIKDLKTQVIEVGERHKRYRSGEIIPKTNNNATIDPRALAIFEDASKLAGIDGPKSELIQLLADDEGESTQQQPKMVSIVGFGGLGKTTLAYQVYQELKGQFDCHAFFSVSRNPDAKTVLKIILSKVKGYSSSMDDIPQLITEISDFLANKRYFIVVDDIWDVEIWDVIKFAFPLSGCDSRIITTTRMNDVAQSCRSSFNGHIYNMKPLSMLHSRQLFHRRLFNSEECPSHLEEVSSQILKKCAGLPLAIIAISGLLANKSKTKDQWCEVDSSIGRGLERNTNIERMIKIISLSYFDLPHHLKTCLLYLSIFPEDHIIKKEMLIRRWIAEGFIHNKDRYTLYEAGEMCFNELLNRSLIQPDFSDPIIFDEVTGCQIHDTILDFIVSKSAEENFVTIVGVPGINPEQENKVRRLSLQNGGEISAGLVLSNVRSLNIFGDGVKIPSLLEFKHLRVLCFEDCDQLEDHHLTHIGNCLHLKCLRLTGASITKVPEEIEKLQNLETLEVDREVLIPSMFSIHGRLVHLSSDDFDIILPNDIEGIDALEVLGWISIGEDQSSNFIRRLGDLRNLRKLILKVSSYAAQRELVCSIRKLVNTNLCCLIIGLSDDLDADNFLEELNLPAECSLQEFFIGGETMSKVPRWMGSLVNLQKLVTVVSSPEDAEILGGLPSLRYLGYMEGDTCADGTEAAVERVIAAHPNHPKWKTA